MDNEFKLKSVYCYPPNLILSNNYDGIVISGGGTKGIIHIGMLHCLELNGYLKNLNKFVGTSIGSIICFLLIIGFKPIDILSHLCKKQLKIDKINILGLVTNFGILSFDNLFDNIEEIVTEKIGFIPSLEELYDLTQKELTIVTYNLSLNHTEYISKNNYPNMSCIEAIKMSSNIPIVFEKYIYNNNFYIDGAIGDNFPVKYSNITYKNSKFICISVCKENTPLLENNNTNILDYINALVRTSFNSNSQESKNYKSSKMDIISLSINEINSLNFDIVHSKLKFDYFSLGYKSVYNNFINKKKKEKVD